MYPGTGEEIQWASRVFEEIESKMRRTAAEVGDRFFPYTVEDGRFVNHNDKTVPSWWTNGFWPGMLWLLYRETRREDYRILAEKLEDKLDEAIADFEELHHDVGFMWMLSAGADYQITGNARSRKRLLHMANQLAGRFNVNGNFIKAWNRWGDDNGNVGFAIIDSMMNIPLLYWAGREQEDPRFSAIAVRHADTILRHAVREDGSVKHIIEFDPVTGAYKTNHKGQGYSEESSWTRGQAWAIYGFALSFLHTRNKPYLDAAKRVANYFLTALEDRGTPPCDFRSPVQPVYHDVSAGAIAACGLLLIADLCTPEEGAVYHRAAVKILRDIVENHCDFSARTQGITLDSTEAYWFGNQNVNLVYADYFLLEGILTLRGSRFQPWGGTP